VDKRSRTKNKDKKETKRILLKMTIGIVIASLLMIIMYVVCFCAYRLYNEITDSENTKYFVMEEYSVY